MAQDATDTKDQPQAVSLFEALEALEKVKIHILQQERDKNRIMEEHARLQAKQEAAGSNDG